MTGIVKVGLGAIVKIEEREHLVLRFEDATRIVVKDLENYGVRTVDVNSVRPTQEALDRRGQTDLMAIPKERFAKAQQRYAVIKPLIEKGTWTADEVVQVAREADVSRATLYRWLKKYQAGGMMTDLMSKSRSDIGVSRLSPKIDTLIEEVIQEFWLTPERRSVTKAHRELQRRCWNAVPRLKVPSLPSFVARIDKIDRQHAEKKRRGNEAAKKLNLINESAMVVDRPYGVLQIDHTLVDIQLVDEVHRVCIGRPWITVAIDVHSRMLASYYVSFDTPGTLATGICIGNAMLSKKKKMQELGIDYDYPCMGKPAVVHFDNAREFHSETIERACQDYGIDLKFRRLKIPEDGSHIERLLGTLMEEIHGVRGTSFSNTKDRDKYDSEAKSMMTLKEFELWLANLICGLYHHRRHGALDTSPLAQYRKGLIGDGQTVGAGIIEILPNEHRVYLDFLPMFEATVQPYGIKIDHITYQSDVLRRWVGSKDPDSARRARRFLCRRDPRDISHIHFFDPDAQRYFRVPYRRLDYPAISLWELRAILRYLADQGKKDTNEAVVFHALNEMNRIENEALQKTKKERLSQREKKKTRRRDSPQPPSSNVRTVEAAEAKPQPAIKPAVSWRDIKPFDEEER